MQLLQEIFDGPVEIIIRGVRRGSVVVDYDVKVPSSTEVETSSISAVIVKAITEDVEENKDGFLATQGADLNSIETQRKKIINTIPNVFHHAMHYVNQI